MKNRRAQFYRSLYRSFYALGTVLLLTGLLLSVAASPADAGFRGIKITSTSRPRDGGDLPRQQQNSLPGVQSQRPQVQGEASPRRQAEELTTGNPVTILAQQASVSFTTGDTALCQLTPITVEATVVVSLPEGVEVILQTAFRVVNPPDRRTDNAYTTQAVKNGDRVTFSGQWPGVRPGDQVVEIHFGAILLSPAGNPISSGAGLDYFWYPYVCSPPTATVPSTATATITASLTATATQPTLTSTGTATATHTATPTQPQDPTETSTSTVTPTQPQSSTSTNTPTNTTTPPTVQVTVPSPTFTVTPTATNTNTPTEPGPTSTATQTATNTITPTVTLTPDPSATHTATPTSTPTVTLTTDPSATFTATVTPTQTPPTVQVTPPTATRTPTASSTATNTPTATFVVFTVTATAPPTLTNTVRVGVGVPSGTPSITPPPTITPDPGSPTARVPITGGSAGTSTPVPSVAPPQISAGATEQVVPVTGAGVTRPTAIPLNSLLFWQRLSTYLGLLVFGLAIFLHGLERRL